MYALRREQSHGTEKLPGAYGEAEVRAVSRARSVRASAQQHTFDKGELTLWVTDLILKNLLYDSLHSACGENQDLSS